MSSDQQITKILYQTEYAWLIDTVGCVTQPLTG